MINARLVGFKFLWHCLFVFACFQATALAQEQPTQISVNSGDTQRLIDAINTANKGAGSYTIVIVPDENGKFIFEFDQPYMGGDNALPVIVGKIVILQAHVEGGNQEDIIFRPIEGNETEFRFAEVVFEGRFSIVDARIQNFGIGDRSGGALIARDNASISMGRVDFSGNFSGINGGAVAATGNSIVSLDGDFSQNRCSGNGGAVTVEGMGRLVVSRSIFTNNNAGIFGCDINVSSSGSAEGGPALIIYENTFSSNCGNVLIENPAGGIYASSNTFSHPTNGIDSTALVDLFSNVFDIGNQGPGKQSHPMTRAADSSTQAACNDFGSGAFQSSGFNVASDDSCALDQDTDQPGMDPQLTQNESGLLIPSPGSPVIDVGGDSVIEADGLPMAQLPCGYVDRLGTARPQDGNGDGSFECDSGAIEVAGTGNVNHGHSGAFFNPTRSGEGNYIEILNNNIAAVYTFTYRPDGSGPAWFLGVGEIRDNSIVIDDLLRPTGTPFGDAFKAEDITFDPAGGMSLIFPTCSSNGDGGGVAFSGEAELGYEGLLTRASRLTSIVGCGITPVENAGLSGSFYDPDRNGEGLIVEWLDNGQVVAIFFTYDPDGNQFWTFGLATPNGKSVTIDAIYPSSSTVWGQDFDPDDVMLEDWGTFELNWTSCNAMTFRYTSGVAGFGSATRDYVRISALQETDCPTF